MKVTKIALYFVMSLRDARNVRKFPFVLRNANGRVQKKKRIKPREYLNKHLLFNLSKNTNRNTANYLISPIHCANILTLID